MIKKFVKWREKIARKISEKNLKLYIIGTFLLCFALGGLLSVQLMKYAYLMLGLSIIILVNTSYSNMLDWYKKKKLEYIPTTIGTLGVLVLLMFFGIQTPGTPFKEVILGIGLLLMIPGFVDVVKSK